MSKMQRYEELTNSLKDLTKSDKTCTDAQYKSVTALLEEFTAQASIWPHLFVLYCNHNRPTKKDEADKKLALIDKCFTFSQNSSNVNMWMAYAELIDHLETSGIWTQAEKDTKMKQVLDKALESVGQSHMDSAPLWIKYIDFETTRNNLSMVNLLCYIAVQTPFNGDNSKKILDKYEKILKTLFESIFKEITQSSQGLNSTIPDRFKDQQAAVVTLITEQFKGEKEPFVDHIKNVLHAESQVKGQARAQYEKVLEGTANAMQWLPYISFEVDQGEMKRAQILYERAMGATLQLQNDYSLWMKYADFIQNKLKDNSLMKAKFEQKLSNSKLLPVVQQVDILIENALFEELNQNTPRARKIFEQLDQEIAPGLVKGTIARINFEKRQENIDRARELYSSALAAAMGRDDALAVTYIACQYARFLAYKCGDVQHAHDIFNKAIANPKCANKVLYLSYINLVKGLRVPNAVQVHNTVKQIFERAIQQLEDFQKAGDTEKFNDMKDICHYYIAYLEEDSDANGAGAASLKDIKAIKSNLDKKGFLSPNFNSKSVLVGVTHPTAEEDGKKLGGIGRKRQATDGIQQLEAQIS